jgi:hypothetical protein
LFDPSLKEKNPIVIEDQDTDEDPSEFTNMEEMAIHTLKKDARGKDQEETQQGGDLRCQTYCFGNIIHC